MTQRDDDRDLRDRFETLRAHEAESAPGYAALRARGEAERSPRPAWARPAAALTAAAAGLALWLLLPQAPEPLPQPSDRFAPGQWTMPSDALLDLSGLPGDGLLRELPTLGDAPPGVRPRPESAPDACVPRPRRPLA